MIRISRCFAFAFICFACSLAFADAGGASADPYALYYPLIATGLGSLGAFVRGYAPADGFWHTWYGHAVLVLIGAVAGSLTPIFEAGHVTKIALISGLVGGGVAFLSALKPTGKTSTAGATALLPLLFLLFGAPGCKTAAGQAFSSCELGKLPATGQTAFATAHDIADNPGSTASDLEAAAMTMLPGQLECGAQALLAWLESLTAPDAGAGAPVQQALMAAHTDVTHEHAKQVLREYLSKHPATACGRGRASRVDEGARAHRVADAAGLHFRLGVHRSAERCRPREERCAALRRLVPRAGRGDELRGAVEAGVRLPARRRTLQLFGLAAVTR